MNSSAQPAPCAKDGVRKTSSNTCANTSLWIVSSNTESAPLLRSAHPFGLPVGRLCRSARLLKPRSTSISPASHLRDQRQPALRPRPQRTTRRNPRPSHDRSNPIHDATLEAICTELNTTEICYPETTLLLVYRPIRSTVFPTGQDV